MTLNLGYNVISKRYLRLMQSYCEDHLNSKQVQISKYENQVHYYLFSKNYHNLHFQNNHPQQQNRGFRVLFYEFLKHEYHMDYTQLCQSMSYHHQDFELELQPLLQQRYIHFYSCQVLSSEHDVSKV